MPVHDWTRVDAGLFHAFHQTWIVNLCAALNAGRLPADYFALPEQNIRGPIPDVLALKLAVDEEREPEGGIAVAVAPPKTRVIRRGEADIYVEKADRIAVRHRHGEIVAVVEVVSPGNKASRAELKSFVDKSTALLRQKIHLLVIDLFPPNKRNPQGIHPLIWDDFAEDGEEPYLPPSDKPLTLAAYDAGPPKAAYIEPIAVGDEFPEMPLFLRPEVYVDTPLASTYGTAWDEFPIALKGLLK
jgi:hypothetical protein